MKNIKYPFTAVGVSLGILFGLFASNYYGSNSIVLGTSMGLALGYGIDKLLRYKKLKENNEDDEINKLLE